MIKETPQVMLRISVRVNFSKYQDIVVISSLLGSKTAETGSSSSLKVLGSLTRSVKGEETLIEVFLSSLI